MTKDARLDMRIPSALKEALEELAEKDRRRLSGLVLIVLEDYVAERLKRRK